MLLLPVLVCFPIWRLTNFHIFFQKKILNIFFEYFKNVPLFLRLY
jgi:hypothetical protein